MARRRLLVVLATGGTLCTGLLLLGCTRANRAQDAPQLTRVTASDLQRRVETNPAPVRLVHFWATWCPPCVEEFPHLIKLRRTYRDAGLELLLISADRPDDRSAVEAFLKEQGVAWDTYLAENINDAFIRTVSSDWGGALPASFFYTDKDAPAVWWDGARPYSNYAATVQSLLP